MPTPYIEYLQEQEDKKYKEDPEKFLIDFCQLFYDARDYRRSSLFDYQLEVGLRIYKDLLDYGVYGDKKVKRQYINFVKRNLKLKISQLLAADVDIDLVTMDGSSPEDVEMLEAEINYLWDMMNATYKAKQPLTYYYFTGMGYCRTIWDPNKIMGQFHTGMPVTIPIDTRKMYIEPDLQEDDKSDNRYFFHVETYTKDKLKLVFPKHADRIDEIYNALVEDQDFNYTTGHDTINNEFRDQKIDVVTCQYKSEIEINQRSITDLETQNTVHYTEEEYREYLLQKAIELNVVTEEELKNEEVPVDELISRIDELGQDAEDEQIFPEQVRASVPVSRIDEVWFQTIYIPSYNLMIDPPKYVGKNSEYSILSGDFNPDSSYSMCDAFDQAHLLELHSALLSLEFLLSFKVHKPQLIIEQGALLNEKEFRLRHGEPGFSAVVDQRWRETHPNQDPYKYIAPPQVSQLALRLVDSLEAWIGDALRANPATRGASEFAGESGKSVQAKQLAAAQGDRMDNFALTHFFTNQANVLKEKIALYRNYPHKQMGVDEYAQKASMDVNTTTENDLMTASEKCYSRISIEDNVEAKRLQAKDEAIAIYNLGALSKKDLLEEIDPSKADKRYENVQKQDEALQLQELLNSMPDEQKEQAYQILEQLSQQSEQVAAEAK